VVGLTAGAPALAAAAALLSWGWGTAAEGVEMLGGALSTRALTFSPSARAAPVAGVLVVDVPVAGLAVEAVLPEVPAAAGVAPLVWVDR